MVAFTQSSAAFEEVLAQLTEAAYEVSLAKGAIAPVAGTSARNFLETKLAMWSRLREVLEKAAGGDGA